MYGVVLTVVRSVKKKKKKVKKRPVYKVYKTFYKTGEYYIGVTSKTGAAFDNYWGSNTTDRVPSHKDIIYITHNKADAKLVELIYQLQNFYQADCLNKMLNIRLRRDHIKKIPRFNIKITE